MSEKIKLLITKRTKKIANSKRQFTVYATKMNLPVISVNEDGKEVKGEPETKWVDLKFGKEVPNSILETIKSRGYIVIDNDNVNAPFVYKVEESANEDGETVKKYPTVWIHGDFDYFPAPKKQNQNAFVLDEEESAEVSIEEE